MNTPYSLNKNALYDYIFNSDVKHRIITFPADKVILAAGKSHQNLYFILKGAVRVTMTEDHFAHDQAVGRIVANLGKNDIFGESTLFDRSPSSCEFAAIIDTEVVEIDKIAFLDYLASDPKTGNQICAELLHIQFQRINQLNKVVYRMFEDQNPYKLPEDSLDNERSSKVNEIDELVDA